MQQKNMFWKKDETIQEELKNEMIQKFMLGNCALTYEQAVHQVNKLYCPDGLMNNGKLYIDNNNIRRALSGNEDELWHQQRLRILFLTKELNAGPDRTDTYDLRQDSFRVIRNINGNHRQSNLINDKGLNKMIAYTFHGMIHSMEYSNEPFLEYTKISAHEVETTIDKYVFARINVKPTGGTNNSNDNEVLCEALKYGKYTFRRIKNLCPKVIVCCGNKNNRNIIIEDFLNKIGFHFDWTDVQGIWTDKQLNIVAIDTYHPSYTKYGYEESQLYNDIVKALYNYIQKNPNFLK